MTISTYFSMERQKYLDKIMKAKCLCPLEGKTKDYINILN